MCEVTKRFKLCTCQAGDNAKTVHNKNSRRYQNQVKQDNPGKITWTLYKYEGRQYSGMDGLLMAPADQLDEMFTAEYVKTELNKRNCFDFDYDPNEGDYLILETYQSAKEAAGGGFKFMPFIYASGQWTINSYNGFYDKTVELIKGKLKLE